MCRKWALVTNTVVAKSYTILLVLFIFMKLCVVKHPVSSSCQHVGSMELISMSPVVPLTVPTCALLGNIGRNSGRAMYLTSYSLPVSAQSNPEITGHRS